jgi:cytochrome c oxidase assembly protein subunit 15
MEWGHRILGRLIGVVFVGPLAYYTLRKKIPKTLTLRLFGLAALIGAQGALGWYMVKSGLEDSLMETPGAIPRVSQYRLAAHLGMAFLLYFGMFWSGMAVIKDYKFAKGAAWSGFKGDNIQNVLNNPLVRSFKRQAGIITGLVLLTAMSGGRISRNTIDSELMSCYRCICGGSGRRSGLQRVSVNGRSSCTPRRRAFLSRICQKPRQIR